MLFRRELLRIVLDVCAACAASLFFFFIRIIKLSICGVVFAIAVVDAKAFVALCDIGNP